MRRKSLHTAAVWGLPGQRDLQTVIAHQVLMQVCAFFVHLLTHHLQQICQFADQMSIFQEPLVSHYW